MKMVPTVLEETFLTAVAWPAGEWPRIGQPVMQFTRSEESNILESQGIKREKLDLAIPETLHIPTSYLDDYSIVDGCYTFIPGIADLSSTCGTNYSFLESVSEH